MREAVITHNTGRKYGKKTNGIATGRSYENVNRFKSAQSNGHAYKSAVKKKFIFECFENSRKTRFVFLNSN